MTQRLNQQTPGSSGTVVVPWQLQHISWGFLLAQEHAESTRLWGHGQEVLAAITLWRQKCAFSIYTAN